jgi:tRNA nucleotidyltransferase/poly(A) polymerase
MSDDPVRILRAVRQAAAFGFTIDKPTREWMKQSTVSLGVFPLNACAMKFSRCLQGPKARCIHPRFGNARRASTSNA